MSWQKWTFNTSLFLWVIVVLFMKPKLPKAVQESFEYGQQDEAPPFSWQNLVLTSICAGIMYTGYTKVRVYLDEMSTAIAACRTSQESHRGIKASHSDEEVNVTRALVDCHDRLTTLIANYSQEIQEVDDNLRANVRLLIEDVTGLSTNIAMIMREVKSEQGPLEKMLKKARGENATDLGECSPSPSPRLRPARPASVDQKIQPLPRKISRPRPCTPPGPAAADRVSTSLSERDRQIPEVAKDSSRRMSVPAPGMSTAEQPQFRLKVDSPAVTDAKSRLRPPTQTSTPVQHDTRARPEMGSLHAPAAASRTPGLSLGEDKPAAAASAPGAGTDRLLKSNGTGTPVTEGALAPTTGSLVRNETRPKPGASAEPVEPTAKPKELRGRQTVLLATEPATSHARPVPDACVPSRWYRAGGQEAGSAPVGTTSASGKEMTCVIPLSTNRNDAAETPSAQNVTAADATGTDQD